LANQASYEVLVISDSDMRITPDYLRRVVAPLADPQTGLVTCLYKGAEAENLTARLEGLYIGVTYLPSILVGRRYLSMRFALGATIALRRSHLMALGGFPALADYLADDYELGARIGSLGWKIHLSSYVILDMLGAPSLRELWHRQVRWARCIRVSRGPEYLGLIITFSTPLALATAITSSLDSWGLLTVATSLVLRWGLSWLVSGYTDDRESQRSLLWLPLSDILTFLVWCGGGVGRKVVWRDEAFELTSGGRMRIPA